MQRIIRISSAYFLNGETVCQGYACATQYLLRLLNIQCAIVTGKADGDAHAWNLVRMDGDYYYLDTTSGNSRYYGKDRSAEKYVNYNYLGITSEEISISSGGYHLYAAGMYGDSRQLLCT